MNRNVVRIGVVGTGYGAKVHVPVFQSMPGVEVIGIVGKDQDKACAVSRQLGISWCPSTAKELIDSPEVDAITIAVPPIEQHDVAVLAFQNGKHVLCEKPLGVTLEDAKRIADAWKRSGRVGMINFGYRLIPELQEFKALLAKGACGRVHSIHAEWILSSRLNPSLTYHWKGQREMGGGVLQNFGTHVVDYLFWDVPKVKLLGAKQDVFIAERQDADGDKRHSTGEEVVTALFEIEGGTSVILHLSLVSTPAVGHRVTARGSKGTLEIRNLDPRSPAGPFSLWFYSGKPQGECLSPGEHHQYSMSGLFSRVANRFIEAIRGEAVTAVPSIACGVRASEFVHTIQISSGFISKSDTTVGKL